MQQGKMFFIMGIIMAAVQGIVSVTLLTDQIFRFYISLNFCIVRRVCEKNSTWWRKQISFKGNWPNLSMRGKNIVNFPGIQKSATFSFFTFTFIC